MGYVSTGMGDRFSALLVSLMPLQLVLVDQNPFGHVNFCHQTFMRIGMVRGVSVSSLKLSSNGLHWFLDG